MIIEITITGGIALALGIGLVYASKKFKVKENPKVREVYKVLPGINCGGCGFGGCNDFAAAVVKDHGLVHGCVVGKEETAEKIGKILGIKVSEAEPKIARVRCQGGKNCSDRFDYQGVKRCNAVHTLMDRKECEYGCIGFGDCAESCKFDALHMGKDGYPIVDPEKCVGCGKCVEACPKELIKLQDDRKLVHIACISKDNGKETREKCKRGCIACGVCVKNCPVHTIQIIDNHAVIDADKCINCGTCVRNCPTKAIIMIKKVKNVKKDNKTIND